MATDQILARDAAIRQAAFDHVRALQDRKLVLTHTSIAQGFWFEGERWPLWNPQRGIFKPRAMPFLLSIRTVVPRRGARVLYDDQRQVHQQIFAGEDQLDYAFMGTNPAARDLIGIEPDGRVHVSERLLMLHDGPLLEQSLIPDLRSFDTH